MSLSPKDMDFLEASWRSRANSGHAAAREIALAIGVPPMLLGIPGDNTYSNYQEANRAFYRQTIIPLATRIATTLTTWLCHPVRSAGRSPALQTRDLLSLEFRPDLDSIEALAPEREASCRRHASIDVDPPGKDLIPHPQRKTHRRRI